MIKLSNTNHVKITKADMHMMNEETYLKQNVGTRNPFTVPDGYFDQLATHVMQQLPERPAAEVPLQPASPKSRFAALRPWLYAAACVVVLLVMSITLYMRTDNAEQQMAIVENSYMDDAADYAMIDNSEIYACLSDN